MQRSTVRRLSLGSAVTAGLAGLVLTAGATPLPRLTPTSPTGTYAEGTSLPNGRLVKPVGRRTTTGDFPVALVLSPDGKTGVLANSGQGSGAEEQSDESLQVVDLDSGRVVQTVRDREAPAPTFYEGGVAFSRDGKHLYATGGGNNQVYDYAVTGAGATRRLRLVRRLKSSLRAGAPTVPGSANGGIPGSAPMVGDVASYSKGVAALPDGSAVIVTNEQGSTVAALSTVDGSLLWETPLGGFGPAGSAYPGAVVVRPGGQTAYVALLGLNQVVSLDTTTGAVVATTPVGDHPVALALTGGGSDLLVANANDDSLSVLDVSGPVPTSVGRLSTHLIAGEANGSTPNAVTVDDRHGRVYVSMAGDDAVAVFDTGTPGPTRYDAARLRYVGAVPTGAYPTAVATRKDGTLLVASAKGLGGAPITSDKQYIVNKRSGLLQSLPRPTGKRLAQYTADARAYLTWPTRSNRSRPADSPIPTVAHRGDSPIEHVVLVVRENRTFDQVFGDLTGGADVEPAYTQFGEKDSRGRTVTPNAHALARQFGLSQNFYSDGEASIQGHHWTAEGVSTDYTEKSYLHYYSERQHPYDPTFAIGYPRCGAQFQQAARQGVTFRNFGELTGLQTAQAPTATPAPGSTCQTPGGLYDAASVAGFSPNLGANLTLTSVADTDKEADIERTLTPLIAAGQMPQLTYAVLGNDHTDGTRAGDKTPQAHVATNDLAVGKLVDFLSHSSVWRSTLVLVVEDDSQDGLDHRDGHRNVLLAAGPYVRKGVLSKVHLDQASVLRTIELVLGLDPISSYTQYAAVPYELFRSTPDLRTYTAVTPTYPLDAVNPPAAAGTASSVPLDLSRFDVAGPVLEAQVWEATRPGEPVPAPLLEALRSRGGIREEALTAWAKGEPCACRPLRDGLTVAPGGDDD